jgi:hypothetical protein
MGRKKSAYTLDKEAFEEFKKFWIEYYEGKELAGVKAHKSPSADKQTKLLLSGNLSDKKELKILFDDFKSKGLIPEYVPQKGGGRTYLTDPDSLTFWLGQEAQKQRFKGFGPKVPGKDPVNQWKIEKLNELIRKTALEKVPVQNRTPEILEDINQMSWKGLPLKINEEGVVSFARRQYSDKVPQYVIDYGNKYLGNDTGTRWAKEARKGWEDLRIQNQKYRELTGFDFDRGHFYPSVRGGPNTIRNASSEIAFNIQSLLKNIAGNRDKKELYNWKGPDVGRELGTSNTWMQDLIEFHLDEKGLNANQLPQDYWIKNPEHALIQQGQSLDEQKKLAQSAIAGKYQDLKNTEQLQAKVDELKKFGYIPENTTVIGDGSKNPVITSFNDLKQYSDATKAGDFEFDIIDGERRLRRRQFIQNKTKTILKNRQLNKTLNFANELTKAVPTPFKKVAGKFTYIGLLDDLAVIAAPFDGTKKTDAQKKLERIQFARGVTSFGGIFLPPVAAMSAMLWTVEELDKHRMRRKENRDWYLEAFANPTSGLGSEVITNKEGEAVDIKNPEWGQGRVINKRGRRVM